MEEKLNGIVVSSVNFGENDKILNIFTLEKGMISARIKGVKKAGAKLKFASEPFCFAEFLFANTLDKRTVTGASLIESFYPLRENLIKLYSASAVLEFIKHFEVENIVSPQMFVLVIDTLKSFAFKSDNVEGVLCQFFIKALSLVGYGLKLDGCFECGARLSQRIYFDFVCGGFFCGECVKENMREINFSSYLALKMANDGDVKGEYSYRGGLRLINYYLINKTEEKLNSLGELIKMLV